MPKHRGVFRTRHKIGKTTVYAKRKPNGRFLDIQSLKRTAARDRVQRAKRKVKSGQGFRGDTK